MNMNESAISGFSQDSYMKITQVRIPISDWSTKDRSDISVNKERILILECPGMYILTGEVHLSIISQSARMLLLDLTHHSD